MHQITQNRGMGLIEVIVGTSVMLIVFGGFFFAANAFLSLATKNRLHASAIHVANDYIEVLRAMPYDSVGTAGGIPPGSIPQNQTVVRDNRTYTIRTFIQYVDDPADETGASDVLSADYKRMKVEVSYNYQGATSSVSFVTTVAPKSLESLEGAGTLLLNILNANNEPLPSATVHIINTTIATSVDVTTFANASGTVSFPGAWAGTGYEVYVSKSGYSSASTYTSTIENPEPSPSPFTVAEESTTEVTFKIDRLSDFIVYTRELPVFGAMDDAFTDASGLASSSDTQVSSGSLTLGGASGTYSALGTATSLPLTPTSLGTWGIFRVTYTTPPQTDIIFQFEYDIGAGVFELIPETDLPGNTAGYSDTLVDLNTLSVSTYASIRIRTTLSSTDPMVTPEIDAWHMSYLASDIPESGVSLEIHGSKIIGTNAGQYIYKYADVHVTGGDGKSTLTDMEFDEYSVAPSAVTVADTCPTTPVVLTPNTTLTQTITLATPSAHTYRLHVFSPLGAPVENAEVVLEAGGVETVQLTGECGVAYLQNLNMDTYTVSVFAHGYPATSTTRIISGVTEDAITLSL
ncbi:MAG: carboxypeptidase regulatory-like domain-containing protein [Candidatus Pacebacteria bacterium]|nr:carboxypeptidase regulatory-like domain-containing protein [Candidatus Paceibacterota bacterium]